MFLIFRCMIFAAIVTGIGTFLLFGGLLMGGRELGNFGCLLLWLYGHILISVHIRWAMYM